ncbi:MAG: hypothetical protein ACOYL3_10705 [Desulfuromonadaceae bacterium]
MTYATHPLISNLAAWAAQQQQYIFSRSPSVICRLAEEWIALFHYPASGEIRESVNYKANDNYFLATRTDIACGIGCCNGNGVVTESSSAVTDGLRIANIPTVQRAGYSRADGEEQGDEQTE